MVACKRADAEQDEGAEGDDCDARRRARHRVAQEVALLDAVHRRHSVDEDAREAQRVGAQEAARVDEPEKEAVVAPADALAHPRAMVVEALDAHIALGAVRRARWPEDVAGTAPLELNRHSVDLDGALRLRARIDLGLLHATVARHDARIGGGGQHEKPHRRQEQDRADHEGGHGQRRAHEHPEGDACASRERRGEDGDAKVGANHHASVAAEGVSAWPGLPHLERGRQRLRRHVLRDRVELGSHLCHGHQRPRGHGLGADSRRGLAPNVRRRRGARRALRRLQDLRG